MPRPLKNAPDKILAGLKSLQSRTSPGQAYSAEKIAQACGVSKRAIIVIEQRAIRRLKMKIVGNRLINS